MNERSLLLVAYYLFGFISFIVGVLYTSTIFFLLVCVSVICVVILQHNHGGEYSDVDW